MNRHIDFAVYKNLISLVNPVLIFCFMLVFKTGPAFYSDANKLSLLHIQQNHLHKIAVDWNIIIVIIIIIVYKQMKQVKGCGSFVSLIHELNPDDVCFYSQHVWMWLRMTTRAGTTLNHTGLEEVRHPVFLSLSCLIFFFKGTMVSGNIFFLAIKKILFLEGRTVSSLTSP